MPITQLTASRRNKTVLIADDNGSMRSILSEILRSCGLRVIAEASDGKQAMESYRKLKPDIVCLDMHMPSMSGIEVLTEIRSESPNAIVVLITGSTTSEFVKAAMAARVDGIIAKPFSAKGVSDEIGRCLTSAAARSPAALPT